MSYIRALIQLASERSGLRSAEADRRAETWDASRPVLIRLARDADLPLLWDLAEVDSARPLAGAALVALVDGEAWAAVSLRDGRVIADPFRATAPAVALLRVRAAQLLGGAPPVRPAARAARLWRRARA